MKVTKEITFDSAHMLSNYNGKCHNLHGHTYKLQVSLEGPICIEGNSRGMVMDFNELKQYLEVIKDTFDHAIIFSDAENRRCAEDELYKWAVQWDMNYVVVHGKCTSETMVEYIKEMLNDLISIQGLTISVRLWETPTSFAEV